MNNRYKTLSIVLAGALAASVCGNILNVSSARADERQPHMKTALEFLVKAQEQLKNASSDKGGHRVKAIALTNEAIEQVQKGIEADNNNGKEK